MVKSEIYQDQVCEIGSVTDWRDRHTDLYPD
jgi:hypothetical protein